MKKYIDQVSAGKIPTSRMIKLLVERHHKDLKKSKKKNYPFYFDNTEPEKVIKFSGYLKHVKGKWRGQYIHLEPFQIFIIYLLFGWKKKSDDTRRFQKVYFQIARKNAKTTLAVIIMLYLFYKESEGEFYSIATKRDQAKISYNIGKSMIEAEKSLSKITETKKYIIEKGDCFFQAMSSEDKKSDGFNPYCVLVDEYHAHKTDEQLQVYQSGMGAREEPLILITTTTGFNKTSPCFEEYERSKKVLEEIYRDETLLPVIYELDKEDNWEDESNWIKANPNLGVSISLEYLRNQYNEATQKVSKKVDFLTKNLNMWVDSKESWIRSEVWDKCRKNFKLKPLEGRECFGALDLSSVNDLTGFTLCFPPEGTDKIFRFIHWCYIPEESLQAKEKYENIQYRKWIDEGYVTVTPYSFIDHSYLIKDIKAAAEIYNIKELAFDRAYSGSVVSALINEGYDLVEFPQGLLQFSQPTKEWETEVLKSHFADPNPVMAWCVSNAVIKPDTNNNYKPLKDSPHKKIDLLITSIMAFNRARNYKPPKRESVYNTLGKEKDEKEEVQSNNISKAGKKTSVYNRMK